MPNSTSKNSYTVQMGRQWGPMRPHCTPKVPPVGPNELPRGPRWPHVGLRRTDTGDAGPGTGVFFIQLSPKSQRGQKSPKAPILSIWVALFPPFGNRWQPPWLNWFPLDGAFPRRVGKYSHSTGRGPSPWELLPPSALPEKHSRKHLGRVLASLQPK